MTSDEYVTMLVGKYAVNNAPGSVAHNAASALIPSLRQWAGDHLLDVTYSGSYAKGTATSLGTDVDLFISLNHDCSMNMKDIYYNLYLFIHGRQFQPTRRNVAINIRFESISLDLVPGRKQQDSVDHSLYRSRNDTWMQTNVGEHIKLVAGSARTTEIRAMKIWRARNRIDFPSFYLELTVLAALKGCPVDRPGENFMTVLQYLDEEFGTAVVVDPVNSNNVVSDDLSTGEKRMISAAARVSVGMSKWENILW
jgi:tRNA nucleotidyltransferase (CCA-adding enzyme)